VRATRSSSARSPSRSCQKRSSRTLTAIYGIEESNGVSALVLELIEGPTVSGTALDGANVRKTLNRILVGAGLHERGPHQLRHAYASLLAQPNANSDRSEETASLLKSVVSRVGIEPTTRRLRVGAGRRKRSKS
jgi:hypothetical protein